MTGKFLPFCEVAHAHKPATLRYYATGCASLLASNLADERLDRITNEHASHYAAWRKRFSASTINCGLRTLRRALRLASEWGTIARTPKISLAKGERQRERVLTDDEIARYLAACEQPWRDCATIMLGTGMRPGEVFAMRWERVQLDGVGSIHIAEGKSRAAKRSLPMVRAVREALAARHVLQNKPARGWVFSADTQSGHLEGYCAKNQHAAALKAIRAQGEVLTPFPPYTMRHTALTRLAESGCDAFTLARIAGHSSITITQRYCHPQKEAIAGAFDRLEAGKVPPAFTPATQTRFHGKERRPALKAAV